jgi:tetratricopeptide (TPR) repeat protein
MSLTDTERDQLAAPRRLEELPPPPFDFAGPPDERIAKADLPVVDLVPDTLEEAEPSFLVQARELAASSGDSPMARSRLAQAAMAVGKRDEATKLALESLKLSEKNPDSPATFAAARILMANELFEEAEQALRTLAPSGPLTVLYATLAAQRDDLDTAFSRLNDESSIDAWDLRGWIALRNRHFDQAVRFYRRAMRKGDPSPVLLTNLGLAHAALGSPDKAIAETRQALARGPIQRQRVAFNLIAFLFSTGNFEDGFRELRRLQTDYPTDIEPVFAEAHWALAVGDAERAERRLRHARTSLWAYATEIQQAELLANLTYLRRYQGAISSAQAANEVVAQMCKIGWKSTRLVSMIPILLDRYSDFRRFAEVRGEVSRANPGMTFHALDFHAAVLGDRLKEASKVALAWERDALFAPEAASSALFTLTQIEDRFEDAIKLGQAALKRMPAATVVANNLAYSLALVGKPEQAKRLLPPEEDGSLYHLATGGLIAAARGDLAEALRLYDQAEEVAKRDGAISSPWLVRLHRRLISVVAPDVDPRAVCLAVELPADWNDHPSLVQCLRMLKRRHAPLDEITIEGGSAMASDSIQPLSRK